jgi:hypothetical protein
MLFASSWHILDVLQIAVYLDMLFPCIGALVTSLFYILLLLVWFDDFFYCPHSPRYLHSWAVVILPCKPY